MLKEINGFNHKYVVNENGEVFNTITGKQLIYRKCKGEITYVRLYLGAGSTRFSKLDLLMEYFPDKYRKEGFADIPGFEFRYGINRNGDVFSYLSQSILVAAPSKTSEYLYVSLVKDGVTKHFSIHRLVAMTYIPNNENLPEVDHINRNIRDNRVENLRWSSRLGNLMNSEIGMTRNFRECTLFFKGKLVGKFGSIKEAAREANSKYGASESGMERNLKSKGCEIKSVTTSPMGRRAGIDHCSKCEMPKP